MPDHKRRSELEQMITNQLLDRGITNEEVLEAFRTNPRHRFVPSDKIDQAYADRPLPIGEGQTISQPYIVALMTELASPRPKDRALEIGTGSGFQSAILASLTSQVYTVERNKKLLEKAKKIHQKLGHENISYKYGDGTVGWSSEAPFDIIIGTGSVPELPEALIDQLEIGGRLVIPVGGRKQQRLEVVTKNELGVHRQEEVFCSFLPLIGKEGWKD